MFGILLVSSSEDVLGGMNLISRALLVIAPDRLSVTSVVLMAWAGFLLDALSLGILIRRAVDCALSDSESPSAVAELSSEATRDSRGGLGLSLVREKLA